MSVFKRNGKWSAKFVIAGQLHWVNGGPWDRKSDAQAAEALLRQRLERRRSDETCASFAGRWLEEWPRPEASTNKLYSAAARRFADHFGSTRLDEVQRVDARSWALKVPRRVSGVIGTMYEDARNVGLVEVNPFAGLRLPGSERKATIEPPTMEEYRRLLAGCEELGGYGPEFRSMITFAAWTGIRQGELFGLQWSDVGAEEIRVARSRKLDGSLGVPKNGQVDTMPFLPPARVLDQVQRWADDPFVFHSPQGRPLIKGTHAWSWNKVKASAHVNCRWHDLRHFCATQLLEMGYSHFDVSVQLRHTDGGRLVMERYGHPSRDAARARLLHGFELREPIFGSPSAAEGSNAR